MYKHLSHQDQPDKGVHHSSMGSELVMHLTAEQLLSSHDMPTCHAGAAATSVRRAQEQCMQARPPEVLQAAMCMCVDHLAMLHCLICTANCAGNRLQACLGGEGSWSAGHWSRHRPLVNDGCQVPTTSSSSSSSSSSSFSSYCSCSCFNCELHISSSVSQTNSLIMGLS